MDHFFVVAAVVGLYLLPVIIAFIRGHKSRWAILVLTVLFGWTIALWFFALIWSLAGGQESQVVVNVGNTVHQSHKWDE